MPEADHEHEKIERLRRAMYSRGLADKLKERPRHILDDEVSEVGEDWQEEKNTLAGVTVAPRYVGATRTILKVLLMIAVLFFVGAVAFFVYFFAFGKGSLPASASNIDIKVTGPLEIAGGDPTELQVSITNRNNISLELADLVVSYPSGTRSAADYATDLPSTRISLGTIEAGGKRQGRIAAVFSGTQASRANVKVELEYHIAGSNSTFVASSDYPLAFRSSPLTVSVDGNAESVSGQPLQFTVNVVSNATAPQRDVVLHVDYPFGYTFRSANPSPNVFGTWYLGDFQPGEHKTVQITGVLRGEPDDARVFHVSAGTRANTASSTITTKFADEAYRLKISQAFLGLSITANKQDGPTATVASDDTVTVSIAYVNNLSTTITDAIIVARLSGTEIDGTTVHSNDGFYRSGDNVVFWDKSTTLGKFSQIAPGESGIVSFAFRVPKGTVAQGGAHVDISVNAAGKRLDESGVPQSLQAAALKKVLIASDLKVAAEGFYYKNPFDGDHGPLPPQASIETTYAVVFTITNTTSKITHAKITAHIPSYVLLTGTYNPVTERVYLQGKWSHDRTATAPPPGDACRGETDVCWNIGDIEPGVGLNGVNPRQIGFAIGFTPSTSQIGQTPVLVRDIVFSGIDSTTGQPVVLKESLKDITTNLAGDPGFLPQDGTVVKPQF